MSGYEDYKVISNRNIANDVYELTVENNGDVIQSGQFYMIRVDNKFLARPISVCDSDLGTITFIYKTFGEGTKNLSKEQVSVQMLGPLGNGWKKVSDKKIAIVGGGVGTPAIYSISRELSKNNQVQIVLGFKGLEDVFYKQQFEDIADTIVTCESVDGKNIIDSLRDLQFDYVYACGPNPMIKAIAQEFKVDGQVSLEEHMACGIGICGGCPGSILRKEGKNKVCIDGPVFSLGRIDV